jgi:hypothetical protein
MVQNSTSVCGYLENNGTITKITSVGDVRKWLNNISNKDEKMLERLELMNATGINIYSVRNNFEDNGAKYVDVIGEYNGQFLNKGLYKRRTYITDNDAIIIGDKAFQEDDCLESIYISDGVIAIGEHAFEECCNLAEVRLPLNLKLINTKCFSGCTSLHEIVIPEGTLYIEYGAFCCCRELTIVSIPGSIKSIGKNVFWGCSKLEKILVPNYAMDKISKMLPEGLQNKLSVS